MVHRNVESVYFLLSFGLKTTKQNLLRDSQIILWVTHQGDVILLQEFLQLLQMSFVRMACSVYFTAMNYVGIPLNKSHFRQATLLGFQRYTIWVFRHRGSCTPDKNNVIYYSTTTRHSYKELYFFFHLVKL